MTNLQGDVTAIVNLSGDNEAIYNYDAFGKITSMTYTTVSQTNPLRYRGYYFDSELGFYYLKSRYYDPTICRFLNADGYPSTGQGFIGTNMFAYCNNNPANCKDPNGQWLIGAIVGGVLGGISAMMQGESVGKVLLATAEGAVVGALAEEGGILLAAGAAVHGVYTACTTEGDLSTKVFKGINAAGSTLLCGAIGGVATSGIGNGVGSCLEKAVVSGVYGVAASGFDYVIQQSDVPSGFTDWWDNTFDNSSGRSKALAPRAGVARDRGFVKMYQQTEAVSL